MPIDASWQPLGFYKPLENRLARFDWDSLRLDYSKRRKAGLLVDDLLRLGLATSEIDALPSCVLLPEPETEAGAIGCLYVLEGATLGGKLISRHLKESLAITRLNGGSFYDAYGARVGMMWKDFCDAANRYCGSQVDRCANAIAGAVDTFQAFERWLTPGPPTRF